MTDLATPRDRRPQAVDDPSGAPEQLEAERRFLLGSLRDLDAEHAAGDIDDHDYAALRDDYTVRAAKVLRAIEALRVPRGQPAAGSAPRGSDVSGSGAGAPPPGRRRRIVYALVTAGVVVFGGLAAWAVTATSGSRVAGQSITGNSNLRNNPTPTVDPRLAQAAKLIAGPKTNVSGALALYDQILKDNPDQPEALANSGWLIGQAGVDAQPQRSDLIDEALARIVRAEQLAPAYADPHFFRGYLLLNGKQDAKDAVTELRLYLGTADPSAPQVSAVEAFLQQAIAAAGPQVPTGPVAPTTTGAAP